MKILGISGKRSSGKDSLTNYITLTVMKGINVEKDGVVTPLIDWETRIDQYGKINFLTENGWELFELENMEPDVQSWLAQYVYPFVKGYAIADPIKHMTNDLFKIQWLQLYGTPEQKQTLTQYKWSGVVHPVPKGIKPNDFMPAREFIKYWGEFVRRFYEDCWIDKTIDWIKTDQPSLSIVKDIRRVNEFNAIKAAGGKVIRLLRDEVGDKHDTETALDEKNFDINNFDVVVDNREMNIAETAMTVHNILDEWGFLEL